MQTEAQFSKSAGLSDIEDGRTAEKPIENTLLLRATINRVSDICPFQEEEIRLDIRAGECWHLNGPSGVGKTSIVRWLTSNQHLLGASGSLVWNPDIPKESRIGILFQNGVLLDQLTIRENLEVAAHAAKKKNHISKTANALKEVGLSYRSDARKWPGQLSGGMLRRACLAQITSQDKRIIVLDEPFTGLDPEVALQVVRVLNLIRKIENISYILISHNYLLLQMMEVSHTVNLTPTDPITRMEAEKANRSLPIGERINSICLNEYSRTRDVSSDSFFIERTEKDALSPHTKNGKTVVSRLERVRIYFCILIKHFFTSLPDITKSKLFEPRWTFLNRFLIKCVDYVIYSAPLIIAAFVAAGMALCILLADLLDQIDVLSILNQIPAFNNIQSIITPLIEDNLPPIKRGIFAMAVTQAFIVELGPLLTCLLLAGRIGGSYAGEVGVLASTKQYDLLETLSISTRSWTLAPSFLAAMVACPILTWLGTWVGVLMGSLVACTFNISFQFESWSHFWAELDDPAWVWHGSFIAYPVAANCYRSVTFMTIIMVVSELISRAKRNLQPRDVPKIITWSVVISSILILFADWFFNAILIYSKSR